MPEVSTPNYSLPQPVHFFSYAARGRILSRSFPQITASRKRHIRTRYQVPSRDHVDAPNNTTPLQTMMFDQSISDTTHFYRT